MRTVADAIGLGSASPVMVADAGLCHQQNLDLREAHQTPSGVGAQLKSQRQALREKILQVSRYRRLPNRDRRVGVFRLSANRRLGVTWCPRRARKDAHDRERAVRKLQKKRQQSRTPASLRSRHPQRRFLRIKGDSRVTLDPERIADAARCDGLHGVVTHVRGMPLAELLDQYQGRWPVEERFRIHKHDLRVRPIFHWTAARIRAHRALSFLAFACVRHLRWRLGLQPTARRSPERVRQALLDRQCSVLEDRSTGQHDAMPSRPRAEAEAMYRGMGLPLSQVPYERTDWDRKAGPSRPSTKPRK